MKRLVAITAALLLGVLGAASPAFAESETAEPSCYSVAGDGYEQTICEDADGTVVSNTTYYDNGCVTTIDAEGTASTTCPEVDPWIDPWSGGYDPRDFSCDVEELTDSEGNAYKFVTCRAADGTVISQARYTDDGCVTDIDADGNEVTNCPTVEPWLPPVPEFTCGSEPWFDESGAEYKLVTCVDVEGTVISKVRYAQDGCVTDIDADGNEVTNCPTVEPWLPPMPEYTCDSEPWFDENGVEYKLVTCTDAEGNVISKIRYAQDGCATEIDADGNEYTYCKDGFGCTWAPDADGVVAQLCPGLNYADLYYSLPEGTSVASVTVGEDGCRLITLSDESTVTACPDPNAPEAATPVALDDRGCIVYAGADGVIWGTDCPGACYFSSASDDGSGNEMATCYGGNTPDNMEQRTLSVCDVEQLLVDGKVLTLATCDDGCTLINGVASGSCTDGWLHSWSVGPRSALWVSAAQTWEQTCWQREPGGDWTNVECPKVMYDKWPTDDDGRVYKSGTLTDDQAGYNLGNGIDRVFFASRASDGSDVVASSAAVDGSDDQRAAGVSQAEASDVSRVVVAAQTVGGSDATIAALPATATTPSAPMSPAVAAMALGVVGVAGAASVGVRRVRVPIRRR